MYKKLTHLLILILFLTSCKNNPKNNNTSDIEKKVSLSANYIAELKKINDSDSLRLMSAKFIEILNNKINDEEKANYFGNLGVIFYQHSMFDDACNSFNMAQTTYLKIGDSLNFTKMRMNQAAMKEISGQYSEAVKMYVEVIKFFKDNNDSLQLANAFSNLGVAYEEMEVAKKSLQYHKKALEIRLTINDSINAAYSYNNIGVVYNELMVNPDSALFYYKKSAEIFKNTNSIWQLATVEDNIGQIYIEKKFFKKAENKFNLILNIYDSLNVDQGKAEAYRSIGQLYFKQRKDYKAIKALKKSLEINTKLDKQKEIIEINKILAKIYIAVGDYVQATKTMQVYNTLKDSILNKENNKDIADIEAKYQLKDKTQTIKLLNLEAELHKKKNRNQSILFILLSVILILIVIILYYNSYKNRLLQKQLRLELQNYILHIDELKTKINEKEDDFTFSEDKIKEYDLSSREVDVLKLIALGYKNAEVAEKLFVSQNTVKSHVKNIYIKLDVKNRVEASKIVTK
jgi:ATP/maltotriose-dependent transcriptional regulator MalT